MSNGAKAGGSARLWIGLGFSLVIVSAALAGTYVPRWLSAGSPDALPDRAPIRNVVDEMDEMDEMDEKSPPPSSTRADEARRPDVVLLVIDTLRVDPLGCYGSTLELTPTIDRLAAAGTRFDHALSTSSWTVPAMASLMTGLWPEEHGVIKGTVRDRQIVGQRGLPQPLTTLAEAFQEQGYFTVGVAANAHLSEPLGFAQGFDLFRNTGFSSASLVIKWLREHRAALCQDRPRFIWVHLFDPHHPYRPRRPWFGRVLECVGEADHEQMRALAGQLAQLGMTELIARDDLERGSPGLRSLWAAYLAEVAYVDDALARVMDIIGVNEHTVIIVTSDHGEEFREHGELGHRTSLYSELVRVPLIISQPARLPTGQVVEEPVSLVDLYPTVLALAGLPASMEPLPGVDLRTEDGFSARPGRRLYSSVWHRGRFIRSMGIDDLRLIYDEGDDRFELFDEMTDPLDAFDLSQERPVAMARLRQGIREHLEQAQLRSEPTEAVGISEELAEQLRRLGYLD